MVVVMVAGPVGQTSEGLQPGAGRVASDSAVAWATCETSRATTSAWPAAGSARSGSSDEG